MRSTTIGLEQELRELQSQIETIDRDAAEKHEAAEALVADYREKGVNPLLDKQAFEAVDEAYKASDTLKENASELRQRAETVMERLGARTAPAKREKLFGQSAVDVLFSTPEYKRLLETRAFESGSGRIELPGVEVASREQVIAAFESGRPLFKGATADIADLVDEDQRRFPPIAIPVRQVRILDLITLATTDSDLVKFVRETTRTDAAAETALGTAYSEASYAYTEDEAAVKDIGHFTPAHRSNLADRGQAQALLEGRLRNGVERRFESEVVAGNGTGQNFEGILENSNIGGIVRDTTNERRLAALHRGITEVRLNLFDEPTAIGLHPTDYHETLMEESDAGGYLLSAAASMPSRTIWGLPVVLSTVFPEGTGLVGEYKQGAVAWIRSGVSVRASDSHSDFFTKRMVALLAEMRAAFAVWQPEAFCAVEAL